MSISLRAYAPADRTYVLSTWARSACSGSRLNISRWMDRHADTMRELEAALHVKAIVAVDAATLREGEPTIVGWVAFSGKSFIHYVYVRQLYRRRGIAKAMLQASEVDLSREIGHTFDGPSLRWLKTRLKLRKIKA